MRKFLGLLLLGVGIALVLVDAGVFSTEETPTTEDVSIALPSTTTTSSTTLPEVEATTTTVERVDPVVVEADTEVIWPELGRPVKFTLGERISCNVYEHTPESSPGGILDPIIGQIGRWTGGGWTVPGQEGPTLLAAHVNDCFRHLKEDAVMGTEMLVEDEYGNVIVLRVTREAMLFRKSEIPWDTLIHGTVEEGQAVTWLFTCGGTEFRANGHRDQNDIVRADLVRIHLANGEVFEAPDKEVFTPGGIK